MVGDPGLDVADGPHGAVHVLRVDRRGETVDGVVQHVDRLFERVDHQDREHRTEDLFLGEAHRGLHVAEDGRLVEEAAIEARAGERAPAAKQLGALLLADLDVLGHHLALRLAHQRADLDVLVEAVSHAQRAGRRDQAVGEPLRDGPVQDEPAGGGAALAGGAERAPEDSLQCEIQVGVVHHDLRVLPSQLQRNALEGLAALDRRAPCRCRRIR